MALLLLDRAQLDIKSEGETLALYEAGQRRGTVPIKLLDRCVIQGAQTRIDIGVLIKLAEAGVTTTLMSPRSPRRVALVLGTQHNDAAVRLAQAQRVMDDTACRQWALHLVRAKLQRQLRTLRVMQAARPDARKPLFDALQTLSVIRAQLQTHPAGDGPEPIQAPTLASLLGLEGAAARAYFAGISQVFAPALGFTGRNRRPPRDPVNALFSLGYTLLGGEMLGMVQQHGLDPAQGLLHELVPGRESLVLDLIEPLRPSVDLVILGMLDHLLTPEDFSNTPTEGCRLSKEARGRFYQAWAQARKDWPDLHPSLDDSRLGTTVSLRQLCRRQITVLRQDLRPFMPFGEAYDVLEEIS